MFIQKYSHFLHYNKLISEHPDEPDKYEKIKFNEFKLADIETRRRDKIDKEKVSIESNYVLTKISKPYLFLIQYLVGSGATSFVFEGYQSN